MDETSRLLNEHAEWIAHNRPRRPRFADFSMAGADLRRANLSTADLFGADLQGADLRRAVMYCATMGEADLRGADLRDACLCGANLHYADLSGADITGACLYGTNLDGAKLDGVDLRKAEADHAWLGHTRLAQAAHALDP